MEIDVWIGRVRWPAALYLLIVMLSGVTLVGCTSTRGSGNVRTETRQVQGFSQVLVDGVGELIVDQTGTESLAIEAEDNILPLLESKVANGQLRLGMKSGTDVQPTKPIHYRLTTKELSALRLTGSVTATGQHLMSQRLETTVSGSGKATLAGQASDQRVSISGSGIYAADQLPGRTASVSVSGSGQAAVNVADALEVSVTGSGAVKYHGSPRIKQSITGSGSVKPA